MSEARGKGLEGGRSPTTAVAHPRPQLTMLLPAPLNPLGPVPHRWRLSDGVPALRFRMPSPCLFTAFLDTSTAFFAAFSLLFNTFLGTSTAFPMHRPAFLLPSLAHPLPFHSSPATSHCLSLSFHCLPTAWPAAFHCLSFDLPLHFHYPKGRELVHVRAYTQKIYMYENLKGKIAPEQDGFDRGGSF